MGHCSENSSSNMKMLVVLAFAALAYAEPEANANAYRYYGKKSDAQAHKDEVKRFDWREWFQEYQREQYEREQREQQQKRLEEQEYWNNFLALKQRYGKDPWLPDISKLTTYGGYNGKRSADA